MQTEAIAARVAPALAELGLECLGVEWNAGRGGGLLRVYIDTVAVAGSPRAPVGVDDCEAASREISALLDVDDPIAGRYTLEVSSPGIERPLFNAVQFGHFAGARARVTLKLPREGQRRLQGTITGVDGTRINMEIDGVGIMLDESEIEAAHLVPDWQALGYVPKPKPGQAARRPGKARKRKG